MAYLSSTTTAPNPPSLWLQGIAFSSSNVTGSAVPQAQTGVGRIWMYNSTHDSTEIKAANFFTDGYRLGMRVGDMVIAFTSTYGVVSHRVIATGATTVQLSAVTVWGSS